MSEYEVGDHVEVVRSPVPSIKVGSVLKVVEWLGDEVWITNEMVELGGLDRCQWEFKKVNVTQVATPIVGNPKYNREIKPGVFVDVYDVLYAFKVTDPCLQHAIKKALAAGQRGHKDTRQDLVDIRDSAQRALDSHDLWVAQSA